MTVCIFCGSSIGAKPLYADAAKKLGILLARNSISLVYGGGKVGLMGVVAEAFLNVGGTVTGVIPDFLVRREVAHAGVTNLEIVESMHARKKRMADLADAFVALPGGWGTLEELTEVLTWRQLGLIAKPIFLLNTDGFFDPLLKQLENMIDEGFVKPSYRDYLNVFSAPEDLAASLYRLQS